MTTLDMRAAQETFFEESRELLQQMEDILLAFESGGAEDDAVHGLFRAAHTIKGSAGLFGLDEIVRFTHVVESVLDRVRKAEIATDSALTTLLLSSGDHIGILVSAAAADAVPDAATCARSDELLSLLSAYVASAPASGPVAATTPESDNVAASGGGPLGVDTWHLSLRFDHEVLRMGLDPIAFIRYLGTLGDVVHLETLTDAMPDIAEYDPEACYLGFELDLASSASRQEIEAVFEFVRDDAQIRILPPHSKVEEYIALILELPEDTARLGEILIAGGALTRRELDEVLAGQARDENAGRRLGEILVDTGMVSPPVVDAALEKQKQSHDKRLAEAKNVKVPSDKLDLLIDLVGELVIAGAGTQLLARRRKDGDLTESASQVMRLVEDVRDAALRLRMVQIGEVFGRFPRVVRDVSRELGKEIELKLIGAETELDKSMVERLGDPLMHLVRNAMDHGLESPEVRLGRGKPASGSLTLTARHESGNVIIEVQDDGAGLDRDKILAKALDKGLIPSGQNLSDEDVYRLIMLPGFSTAERVTNLSGRGVGMDVVNSGIEALRGSIEITSQPGLGTSIRLCLPLTLAIIDGFLIDVGGSSYVLRSILWSSAWSSAPTPWPGTPIISTCAGKCCRWSACVNCSTPARHLRGARTWW